MNELYKIPAAPTFVGRHFTGGCLFRNGGPVDQKLCEDACSVVPNNVRCSEAQCASPWRACRACILQGKSVPPGHVVDAKSGLCDWHTENGADTVRPRGLGLVEAESGLRSISAAKKAGLVEDSEDEDTEGPPEGPQDATEKKKGAKTKSVSAALKTENLKKAAEVLWEEGDKTSRLTTEAIIAKARDLLKDEGVEIKPNTLRQFWYLQPARFIEQLADPKGLSPKQYRRG